MPAVSNAHTESATVARDDLPTGEPMPDWQPRPRPSRVTLAGRYCRLEPLDAVRHTDALRAAYAQAPDTTRDWTYLSVGPFADAASFRAYIERISAQGDPLHFAVVDRASGQALGTLALMNQRPEHGVVEVGFVVLSPALQRSRLATEAQALLMRYVFDELGYRRYEWKCDSLHARSRAAAQRLGFHYEGLFRQAIVYKQRSRDTAWFSIIDKDWPHVKAALSEWLRPENFDTNGEQITRLQALQDKRIKRSKPCSHEITQKGSLP